jgi:DNA-binding LacI/PurR family transcriptional regulator
VFFDRIPRGYKGDAVFTDLSAAYRAVRYLIELGHRRIANITGTWIYRSWRIAWTAGRRAIQEAGLAIPIVDVQQGDFTLASGHRCGVDVMRLPDPPTAIFSCHI